MDAKGWRVFVVVILTILLLLACNVPASVDAPAISEDAAPDMAQASQESDVEVVSTDVVLPSSTATQTASITPTFTPTLTETPTATFTATATATATFTPIPTYVVMRGKVIIDQAVCHYGPGAPYLYKYGVYKGSNLEVLSRESTQGIYIEVQAIGGDNPCWVKAEYMELAGELENVQPMSADEVKLPSSPYYGPLTGISAVRNGDEVMVSWNQLVLRAGDDSLQTPYIVEAWICRDGQIVFEPVGSWYTSVAITDEAGCEQESHARVMGTEKHGYTKWVVVPWPPADE